VSPAFRPSIHAAACLLALCLASSPAWCEDLGKVSLTGFLRPGSYDFTQTGSFTEFAEEAHLDARHTVDAGPGFELGFQIRAGSRLAVRADVSVTKRDQSAAFTVALPHPLYFDQPRLAEGQIDDLSYDESALHVDLVYAALRTDRLVLELLAGASLFRIKSDLIERIDYSQTYPFDSVSVSGVASARVEDTSFGFNLGVGLDYRLGARFGLGAQLRFSQAKAELVSFEGSRAEIDAGGIQAGIGVRLFF